MRTNWISKLAVKYRRSGPGNRAVAGDIDARRVHRELDAIRVRFPDHS